MKKSRFSFFLALCFCVLLPMCALSAKAANEYGSGDWSNGWELWSQGQSKYQDMQGYGCLVVAQAKMLAASGIANSNPSIFNPDVYYEWELNTGYVDAYMYTTDYGGPQTFASQQSKSLTYEGVVYSDCEAKIWENINAGKYSIIRTTDGGSHYVLVNNGASAELGRIQIFQSWNDPSIPGTRDWTSSTSEVLTYSGGSSPEPQDDPVTPPVSATPHTAKAFYSLGSTVTVEWTDVPRGTNYWVNVYFSHGSYSDMSLIFSADLGDVSSYKLTPADDGCYRVYVEAANSGGTAAPMSCDFYIEGFTYSSTGNGVVVTGYNGTATDLTIPPTLGGQTVIGFGHMALAGCSSLTSVTIPYTVTSIGSMAFSECSSLKSVTIPNGVKSIGNSAFSGCSSLTNVMIPDGVTNIGELAFKDCSSLTNIAIPDGVTSIGKRAFYGCESLTMVTIPLGVTCVENDLFHNCSRLRSVVIPNTVSSIGGGAFEHCASLQSVTIPDNVTSIGNSVFDGCGSLTSVILPKKLSGELGFNTFRGCSSLTSVTIPNGVTGIGQEAFSGCSSLTSVTIPNSVTSIGGSAFSGCSSLKSVSIPDGVTGIGEWTFSHCGSLESVKIGSGVTDIGKMAFYVCESLTSVVIPDGVTSIGEYAFASCSSLRGVVIPESVTSIGEFAFNSNTELMSVTFGSAVAYIGRCAFSDCKSLTSVTIPDGVTGIEDHTFYNCSSLESVTISNGVAFIATRAFDLCASLKDVYYGGTAMQWRSITISPDNEPLTRARLHLGGKCGENLTWTLNGEGTLTISGAGDMDDYKEIGLPPWCSGDNSGINKVIIYPGVTSIGGSAFFYCSALENVTIPASVTCIGDSAFFFCSSLTSVTIPNSVTSIGDFAFAGCGSLTDIDVTSGNSRYCSMDGVLFNKDRTRLVAYPAGKEGAYTIPAGVTSIESFAFFGCSGLINVTVPASVTSIGDFAFDNCSSLIDVYYGAGSDAWNAISIGDYNEPLTSAAIHFGNVLEVGIKADKTSAAVGDTVTWTASASGGSGTLQYCFYIYQDGAVVKKGSYGSAKTYSYIPTAAGAYTAKVFVKDASGSKSKMSVQTTVTAAAALAVSSIQADKTSANVGDTITWTASASGGSGTLQYCFYIYKDGATVKKGSYGSAKTCSYIPTAAGVYTAKVFVKDASGTVNKLSASTTVGSTGLTVSSIKSDKTSAVVGDTITWTASASGGSGTLQYCFYVYKDGATVKKGSYGSAKTFSYTATAAGAYTAKVFVKDASGTVNKLSASTAVGGGTLTVSSIKADKTSAVVGDTITWTASASGGSGTLQYCFYVYKDGATVKKGSYGTAKTFSYVPAVAGSYTAKVFVKDASGTVNKLSGATAVGGGTLTVSSIQADKTSAAVGDTITWTASASGGSGTLQYCFYVYKDGATVKKGSYGTAKTFGYTAAAAGSYTAKVFVKDASGTVTKLSTATAVGGGTLTVSSIQADKTSANVGDTITWTASASGGSGTLQYCFYVYKDGATVKKGSYGTARTFTYTATAAGAYTAKVFVKDASGLTVSLLAAAAVSVLRAAA